MLPPLVMISIWIPEVRHYYVRVSPVAMDAIEYARTAPSDAVLDEISNYRLLSVWRDAVPREQVLAEAESILRGKFRPDDTEVTFKWPLDADDLSRGSSLWQFQFAAFIIPDRLLGAYLLTGNELYFDKTLEFVKAWHALEQSAWLARGLLWNDHSVAERIYVLVDVWRVYRRHKNFDPKTAEEILTSIARCAQILAKPDHFTFATNHGVMQNLALMHAGIAVPQLPSAARYAEIGRSRIEKQWRFYVSPEGPVLEHSAFYHYFGLTLLGMYGRYMALTAHPLPAGWRAEYDKAVNFFGLLRRPDGSLPLLGDTYAEPHLTGPPVLVSQALGFAQPLQEHSDWKPSTAVGLYPLSGYSVWWTGLSSWPNAPDLSQLLVTWSHFPGHGHQRAQELSLMFWASGQTWWTNSGYWAYDHPARRYAETWSGSGAPHAAGEAFAADRESTLRAFVQNSRVRFLDVERQTPEGLRVRRQVLDTGAGAWLALDESQDELGRPVSTRWTTFPDVSVEPTNEPNTFLLRNKTSGLRVSFVGAEGVSLTRARGANEPWMGWVWMDGRARPADAFMVTHNNNAAWSAVIWSLNTTGFGAAATPRVAWTDAEHWGLTVQSSAGILRVSRVGNIVQVGDARLDLQRPSDVSMAKAAIHQAFSALQREFPKFPDRTIYRVKVSYALALLVLLQFIVYFVMRSVLRRYTGIAMAAVVMGWLVTAMWLHIVYLV